MPDHWIAWMARTQGMIRPCARSQVRSGRISYGISSYGYDFRLSNEFKIPAFGSAGRWDPKQMDEAQWIDHRASFYWIPPNACILGRSLEYFRIPRGILAICQGKSTYARCGIIVNVTPFEPEWEGFATVALVNSAPIPVRVHAGEGIAQLIFVKADGECMTSYADRKGKYQAQRKIQVARL